MKGSVRLSSKAKQEIQEISDFTVERFGEQQARLYISGFQQAALQYSKAPDMGQTELELSEMLDEPVSSFRYQSHRAYYAIRTDHIRIISVLHAARDKARAFTEIKSES